MDTQDIKIFIACHKKFTPPHSESDLYIPLQVGAANKDKFTEVTDSTGDNISLKNSTFCELTALYWIWKNIQCDIVGLVHYRRYFFKGKTNNLKSVLQKNEILDALKNSQIIVPSVEKIIRYTSIKDSWEHIHIIDDWNILKATVEELYPDYKGAFYTMENSNKFYICNMFIGYKEIINSYCEWLFKILFEVEKRVDISNYNNYNKRIFGFMSERLFNVWLLKNKIKVVEMPVFNTDSKLLPQIAMSKIKSIL